MRTRLEETKIRLFAGASDFANADDGTVQELRGVIQVEFFLAKFHPKSLRWERHTSAIPIICKAVVSLATEFFVTDSNDKAYPAKSLVDRSLVSSSPRNEKRTRLVMESKSNLSVMCTRSSYGTPVFFALKLFNELCSAICTRRPICHDYATKNSLILRCGVK